ALARLGLTDNLSFKDCAYSVIAAAQANAGEIARAQKTVELIANPYFERIARRSIDAIQAGTQTAAARPSCRQVQASAPANPYIWLQALDAASGSCEPGEFNVCPLNTLPFLDLALHLK